MLVALLYYVFTQTENWLILIIPKLKLNRKMQKHIGKFRFFFGGCANIFCSLFDSICIHFKKKNSAKKFKLNLTVGVKRILFSE